MFINGTYRILYIDSGSGFEPVGCLTNHSFSESSEVLDTTTRDNNGWVTSRPTNQNYSIPFDGLVLEDDLSDGLQTYYDLTVLKRNRTLIQWRVDETHYGSGYITELSDENSIDENVSFSAEILGYGKPLIQLDVIFNDYKDRSTADGGSETNNVCLRKYINSILKG